MAAPMRRADRAISNEEALEILSAGEYGVLSTVSPDGQPYGVPVNFCVLDESIYFHCATEGQKSENIAANTKVSFCVVGRTRVQPEKFATLYESAIVSGAAVEVFDREKRRALEGLVEKYSPAYREAGLKYIDAAIAKTKVYKILIFSISGKARRMKQEPE